MPTKNPATKLNLDLNLPTGAILLAHQFLPKYKLSVSDVCPVLNMSRDGLYKRIRNKNISLKISKDELGRNYISLFDLISYLFPETSTAMPSGISQLPMEKRKRGRPRKLTEGGVR